MVAESYSCASNRVEVTDEAAVRNLLAEWSDELNTPYTFREGVLSFDNPTDTFDVYDEESGSQLETEFLEALAPLLKDTLLITNQLRNRTTDTGVWIVEENTVEYRS